MEFFDSFPFTKLQGKNRGLDWVMQKLSEFQKEIDKIPEYVQDSLPGGDSSHEKDTNNPHKVTAAQIGAVPTSRTVNGKPLSSNVTLSASDVGAVPTSRTVNGKPLSSNVQLTASNVGAVPTSRTVNGKPLSSNVTLTADDVGAQKPVGIGTYTGDLDDYASLMNTCAWFDGSSVTNSPTTTAAIVETWGTGGTLVVQRVTTINGYVITRMRSNKNGVINWSEWEFDVPAMTNGREYRTTKKVNGKTVYMMRVSIGNLPNNEPKRQKIAGFTSACKVTDVRLVATHNTSGHAMQLSYATDPGFFIEQSSASLFNIVVSTTGDFSAYSGYATIEYTKEES